MTPATPGSTPDLKQLSSAKRHRRQSRLEIVLPVVLAGLLPIVVVAVLVLLSPQAGSQASIISGLLLICLALLPMVLCLFMLYAILIAALYYMGRANRATAQALRQTQVLSRRAADQTNAAADRANRWSIGLNARFSRFDPILTRFDRRAARPTHEDPDHD